MRFVRGMSISFHHIDASCWSMNEDQGKEAQKPKSDARVRGMIATYVLLFLAVFTGFLVFFAS